jgi:hypothetical protein
VGAQRREIALVVLVRVVGRAREQRLERLLLPWSDGGGDGACSSGFSSAALRRDLL